MTVHNLVTLVTDLEAENEQLDDTDPIDYKIIIIIVSVVAVLLTLVVMLTICIRAKWRVVCRKRRTPTSHPDDINYPHGYTQVSHIYTDISKSSIYGLVSYLRISEIDSLPNFRSLFPIPSQILYKL